MTSKFNFTKTSIDALPLPLPGQRAEYWDAKAPGLQLRVSGTGAKTFYIKRRAGAGRVERVRIGTYPAMTPEQARKKATEVNATIAKGESPAAGRKRAKLEAKTLQEVLDDYVLTRKDLKPRTVQDMKEAFREVCPDWLNKPLTKITPAMVEKRHREHGEQRSKARANLGMRYLQVLFNYAIARYQDGEGRPLIERNPVKRLSELHAWYKVERRQTVIKSHELGDWVSAVNQLPGETMRDYLLVLALTGMRKQEGQRLKWADVDMVARTFTIRDPKNGRDHTLPMSDYLSGIFARRKETAKAALERRLRDGGKAHQRQDKMEPSELACELVFADERGRVVSNFRYAQAAVEKVSGVAFCLHDLRRTFATLAESLDLSAYAVKRLLNHANGNDVTAGYIVANVERLREPMQKITDYVLKSAGIKETAEVIDLVQHRG